MLMQTNIVEAIKTMYGKAMVWHQYNDTHDNPLPSDDDAYCVLGGAARFIDPEHKMFMSHAYHYPSIGASADFSGHTEGRAIIQAYRPELSDKTANRCARVVAKFNDGEHYDRAWYYLDKFIGPQQ